jgi:uncharacterized protein YfdQ (DUF2303 family)
MDPITELEVVGSDGIAAALEAAVPHAQVIENPNSTVHVVARRQDRTIEQLDLERYEDAPFRPRGTVKALDPEGFVALHRRLADDSTTIYANSDTCALVAVINDDLGTAAGWRDHRIALQLQPTPEWKHWTGHQGLGTQARFAETIEDGQDEIVGTPNATIMLEIAQKFEASVGGKFRQEGNIADGSTAFVYEETVEAKVGEGLIPVPKNFTVKLRPFYGAEPREIEARVKYTCRGGELKIGYVLTRPDEFQRQAFLQDVLGYVEAELPDAASVEGVPAEPTPAGRR